MQGKQGLMVRHRIVVSIMIPRFDHPIGQIRRASQNQSGNNNRGAENTRNRQARIGSSRHDTVTDTGPPRQRAAIIEKALAPPAEIRRASRTGHMTTAMIPLYAGLTKRARLGVQDCPDAKQGVMGLVRPPHRAHMQGNVRNIALTLGAGLPGAPGAAHDGADGGQIGAEIGAVGEDTEVVPAQIGGAPAGAAGVVVVPGAEVEHFAEGAVADDGGDVGVGCEDAAAAVHAEQARVVAGVDGARPVLFDARGAVAVRAGGAAAEEGGGDVLAADVAEDGVRVRGEGGREGGWLEMCGVELGWLELEMGGLEMELEMGWLRLEMGVRRAADFGYGDWEGGLGGVVMHVWVCKVGGGGGEMGV